MKKIIFIILLLISFLLFLKFNKNENYYNIKKEINISSK